MTLSLILLAIWYGPGVVMAPFTYALWYAHWQRRWGRWADEMKDDSRRVALQFALISVGLGWLSFPYAAWRTRRNRRAYDAPDPD